MKLKSILMTAALGLALGSAASAAAPTVTLHFTGSTAFRANTRSAIVHCFDADPTVVSDGTNDGFRGNIGGVDTFVSCYWSGSEAGVLAVSQQVTANKINFVAYTAIDTGALGSTVSRTPVAVTMPGSVTLTSYLTDATYADVAMADAFQSSSAYKAKVGTRANNTYATLTGADGTTDGIVGIVPFKWLASHGTSLTGITSKQASALYSNGYLPLSFFTGNSSDSTSWVYAFGRDSGSGTRLITATEMGLSAVGGLVQYNPLNSSNAQVTGTGVTIASLAAPGTTYGLSAANNGGYSSGGTLCKMLWNSGPSYSSPVSGTATLVGYAGQVDADTAHQGIDGGAGAVELAWNGVTLGNISTNYPLIAQGKYTFWGYEHAYIDTTKLTNSSALTIVAKIANQIKSGATTGTPDAPRPYLTDMVVERAGDGSPVTLKAGNTSSKPF